MTALALFDLDEAVPASSASNEADRGFLAEQAEVYRWLCQRGWTVIPNGPVNTPLAVPAWVCASCGSAQPNEYLMTINGHTRPQDLVRDEVSGRWLLQPWAWGTWGCHSVFGSAWAQFSFAWRSGDPAAFDPARWTRSTLPWFPTREAAEALS